MTCLATNKRIAALKGWTNINELGGSLIGTPPEGVYHSRGQRLVPNWTGDKAACFELYCEQFDFSEELIRNSIVEEWFQFQSEEMPEE